MNDNHKEAQTYALLKYGLRFVHVVAAFNLVNRDEHAKLFCQLLFSVGVLRIKRGLEREDYNITLIRLNRIKLVIIKFDCTWC